MAVKVLEKKKLSYITTCKECGSRIQCDEADLETDVFGYGDGYEVQYVKCPVCKRDVKIFIEGKKCFGVKKIFVKDN